MHSPKIWAVLPAAGSGSRMNSAIPKQYLTLAGRPVISHVLEAFDRHPRVDGIVVALAATDDTWPAVRPALDTPLYEVTGGATRMLSVLNGLSALLEHAAPEDWVMVHDAARPCLTQGELDHLIEALHEHPVGGLLGVPITDTVKRVDGQARALETLDRSELWRAFTPQMFRLNPLHQALSDAVEHDCQVTDEAAAMERMGHAPQMVRGLPSNIKITHAHDLALAEFHLNQHEGRA